MQRGGLSETPIAATDGLSARRDRTWGWTGAVLGVAVGLGSAAIAILVEGDGRLLNEYGVTPLKAAPRRPVNERDAEAFAAWLASPRARELISSYRVAGERAFYLPGEARTR